MKEMKSKQGVILRSQSWLNKQAIWGFYGVETGLTVQNEDNNGVEEKADVTHVSSHTMVFKKNSLSSKE